MRLLRSFAVLGLSVLAGCYVLQPALTSTPVVGTEMAFDINDVGRVALGGAMGPEISQIEGRVVGGDSAVYQVAVTSVRFLRGGEQTWTGERVLISSAHVTRMYEKRFSRGRTIAAGAIGVGLVAILASQKILGDGSIDRDPLLPDTSDAIKIPLPRP